MSLMCCGSTKFLSFYHRKYVKLYQFYLVPNELPGVRYFDESLFDIEAYNL